MSVSSSHVENAFLGSGDEVLASLSAEERMMRLSESLQKIKDRPYEDPDYVAEPKYKIGDLVVVCSEYYYFAKIMEVAVDFMCPELHKIVPSYRLKYRGWGRYDGDWEWAVEYDISALNGPRSVPLDLWFAHRWNVCKKWSKLKKEKKKGIFVLEKEHYRSIALPVDEQFRASFSIDNQQMTLQRFLDLP